MNPSARHDLPGDTGQLPPPLAPGASRKDCRAALRSLLAEDLDLKGQHGGSASHNFHAFAARFPPQLPRRFIAGLSRPGELVLDPMMGSGTVPLEAGLLGRRAVGFDLDPLARRQALVKTTPIPAGELAAAVAAVAADARSWLGRRRDGAALLRRRYSPAAVEFIEYWFLPETQRQLLALLQAMEALQEGTLRRFMELAFSSVIITKSGGVSRARDLAHSRPHRVLEKVPRDAVTQFEARARKNAQSLALLPAGGFDLEVREGDARCLPVADCGADLVVTSPPYANAIDYMRAHKFSLVWFGERLEDLAELRSRYLGTERVAVGPAADLPPGAAGIVDQVARLDPRRGRVLHRYFHDMGAVMGELLRVLRPGAAAVVVVGSSTMRGVDVQTHDCLAEIARRAGFEVVGVVPRNLDRDRRMMPARRGGSAGSGIEERMHREFVIGGVRPVPGAADRTGRPGDPPSRANMAAGADVALERGVG